MLTKPVSIQERYPSRTVVAFRRQAVLECADGAVHTHTHTHVFTHCYNSGTGTYLMVYDGVPLGY